MNLKDFYKVLKKVNGLLTEYDPTVLYQRLMQAIENARSSPSPDHQVAVTAALAELIEYNELIEKQLAIIPHSSMVLDKLGVGALLGSGANVRLRNTLSNQQFIATLGINEIVNQIAQLRGRISTIIQQLDQFELKFDDENEYLLSFTFASRDDLSAKDIRERLETIEEILHSFARLSDKQEAFKSPNIVSVSKSSPLIIDVGNGVEIATTLALVGRTIKWILDRLKQIAELQLMHEELRNKRIKNDQLEKGFKAAEKDFLSESAFTDYAKALVKETKSSDATGAITEKEKAIQVATKKLADLISAGDEVQVFLPPEAEEQKGEELTVEISELTRSLENVAEKLKQLSSGEKKDTVNEIGAV